MHPRERRKKNSTKVNLIVSAVFHAVVIGALVYFAARQGLLGQQMKTLSVALVPKEKEPEQPKEEKPPEEAPPEPEPQAEPEPQPDNPPPVTPPPARTVAAPPPSGAPVAAPPPAISSAFVFTDGAKAVVSTTDRIALYRTRIETMLRNNWKRPAGVDDVNYVAEIEVRVDPQGRILPGSLKKRSGVKNWDDSVLLACESTPLVTGRPADFPETVLVRFDVQPEAETIPLN
jgi:hypothetical protein